MLCYTHWCFTYLLACLLTYLLTYLERVVILCRQWQDIDTQGATDAEVVRLSKGHQLLIIANCRSNAGMTRVMSIVYEWNIAKQQFISRQYVATRGAKSVQSLTVHSTIYVVFANSFDSVTQTSEIKSVFFCYFRF